MISLFVSSLIFSLFFSQIWSDLWICLFSHFSHLLQLQMWHAALPSLDSRLQKVSSAHFWRLLFSSLNSLKIFLMTVLSPVEDVTCAIHTATSSPNWTSQEPRTFLRRSHVIPIVKRLWSHRGLSVEIMLILMNLFYEKAFERIPICMTVVTMLMILVIIGIK